MAPPGPIKSSYFAFYGPFFGDHYTLCIFTSSNSNSHYLKRFFFIQSVVQGPYTRRCQSSEWASYNVICKKKNCFWSHVLSGCYDLCEANKMVLQSLDSTYTTEPILVTSNTSLYDTFVKDTWLVDNLAWFTAITKHCHYLLDIHPTSVVSTPGQWATIGLIDNRDRHNTLCDQLV